MATLPAQPLPRAENLFPRLGKAWLCSLGRDQGTHTQGYVPSQMITGEEQE